MLLCKEKENIFSAYISKNKATPVDKIPNKNSFNNNFIGSFSIMSFLYMINPITMDGSIASKIKSSVFPKLIIKFVIPSPIIILSK